jgi:hypothetical protein
VIESRWENEREEPEIKIKIDDERIGFEIQFDLSIGILVPFISMR